MKARNRRCQVRSTSTLPNWTNWPKISYNMKSKKWNSLCRLAKIASSLRKSMLVWKKKYSLLFLSTPKLSTCVRIWNGVLENHRKRSNTSVWCKWMRKSKRSKISWRTCQRSFLIASTVNICLFSQAFLQTTDDLQRFGNKRVAVRIALFHALQHGGTIQARPHWHQEERKGVAGREKGEQIGQIKKGAIALHLPQQEYRAVKIRWALQLHLLSHLRTSQR